MSVHLLRTRSWLLAGLDIALVLLLAGQLRATPASPPPQAMPSAAALAPSAAPPRFTMPPLARYREVTERPLFVRSRRPDGAESGHTAEPASELSLVGIVISPTGRQALLQFGNPSKLVQVKEGQTIDGWTVESIRPNLVLVRQGGTLARVAPKDLPAGTADAAAAAPPPTAPTAQPTAFGSLRRAIKRAPRE